MHGTGPPPRWSRPREGLTLFTRGATVRVGWRVSLVVGTVLSLINQGAVVLGGDATTATWVRIGLNYVVPFVVASWGFLAACRDRGDGTSVEKTPTVGRRIPPTNDEGPERR